MPTRPDQAAGRPTTPHFGPGLSVALARSALRCLTAIRLR